MHLPLGLGYVLMAVLNLLAGASALALAMRARLATRSEVAVAAAMLWNGLVMVPVYGLGLVNRLYPVTLAVVSGCFFVAVLAAACGKQRPRDFGLALGRTAVDVARIPFIALRAVFASRSLAIVGIVLTLVILLWSAFTSYLSASWRQWDSLWYHEPIIGFTIQNHGLAFVDLPQGVAQKINGYPRLSELTDVWFVLFTDRRMIDLANHLMAPVLVLSTYVLSRRFSRQAIPCAVFSCAVLMMPCSISLLGSTYVDVHNAVFVVAGAHFATRPAFRLRHAWLAAVCLALAIGSKWMALVPVGVLSVITLVRVYMAHGRRRLPAATLTVLGGAGIILAIGATTYLRNYLAFHNPFWPDFKYDNERFGIHWPGAVGWGSGEYGQGVQRIDMNLPVSTFMDDLLRIPYTVPRGCYNQTYDYGVAMAWVLFPLMLVAVLAIGFLGLRAVVGNAFSVARFRLRSETRQAGLIALTFLVVLYMSPALWSSRYQIAALGLGASLVAWLTGRPRFERLAEGAGAAVSLLMLIAFAWTTPRWWLWPTEAKALAAIPYPAREVTPASALAPELSVASGSGATLSVGLAREAELTADTTVAFPDRYGSYLALFWNNRYSNEVVYVPEEPNYLENLARTPAKWAYAEFGDPNYSAFNAPGSGWQLVGTLNVENWGAMFRRTGR